MGKPLEGEKRCGRASRPVRGTENWETMLRLRGKLVCDSWKLRGNEVLVAGAEHCIVQ